MSANNAIPGMVIAATKSGSGKTTLTLGLLAALTRRGLKVAPFKVGPDFIDPGHHGRIAQTISRNLDGWMLSKRYNQFLFEQNSRGADVAVVEGVMGLFDGYDGRRETGSTAEMAKWLDLPVVLVVDARSMARSAAALVQGFERFDKDLDFAGLIFNQVGSPRHLSYLQTAIKDHTQMPCLGGVFRKAQIQIPERHLGLFTDQDHPLSPDRIEALAAMVEDNLDLDGLLARLPNRIWPQGAAAQIDAPVTEAVRIGVARDNAFCFYYQDNLDLLAAAGAHLVFFSPLAGDALPPDLDGLYLGGGYPELYARQLAGNHSLRHQIHTFATAGMPIYGECGGFMYLGEAIADTDGRQHAMAGVFPFRFQMLSRLKSLGYREVRLKENTLLGQCDTVVKGHEFHYSEIIDQNKIIAVPVVYAVASRTGIKEMPQGYQFKRCLGSYIHLHFGSNDTVAKSFVGACRAYRSERDAIYETRRDRNPQF